MGGLICRFIVGKMIDYRLKKIDRSILRLAIPSVLTAISAPLMGLVDTAMIGHLPEVASMGAVATSGVLFSMLYWSAGFLRMGTTSLVAQYYGANNRKACAHTLFRSFIIATTIGIITVFFGESWAPLGFKIAGGSIDVQRIGQEYLSVRILELPIVLVLLSINGFFLGTANPIAPLWIAVTANLVNILADYALIYGNWGAPELGVIGAGWASVIGNATAFFLAIIIAGINYLPYWKESLSGFWDKKELLLILRTNTYLFGRTLCLQFVQFSTLSMVSRLGEIPLAANAVIWQLWGLSSFAVDGFAHSAETLVGNLIGKRRYKETRAMASRVMLWGVAVGGVFGVVFLIWLNELSDLFTVHSEVALVAGSLWWIVAPVQPLNAIVFVLDGIFIGANDTRYMFRAMLISVAMFFVPLAVLLFYFLNWGIEGVWLAYTGLMVGRLATLWPRYRKDSWITTFD